MHLFPPKRSLASLLAALLLFSMSVQFLGQTFAASPNLVSNPSAETVDPANSQSAQDWNQGKWGTNASTFSYANTGNTGTHSLSISTTDYTSGDAKWYFKPVAISSSTSYTFSDYYQSSVATTTVAQFDNGNGAYTYMNLATVPTAATWTETTSVFTSPETAKNVTIFHLINSVGTLTIDDVSLELTEEVTPPITPPVVTPPITPPADGNLITNGSLETAGSNTSLPAGWQQGGWGTNTAAYSYASTGAEDGARSGTVTISKFTSGDAKWFFNPVAVTAGNKYTFSNYYKSTVATSSIAQFDNGNGSYYYVTLGNLTASPSAWQQFTTTITVPDGMVHLTVFHAISAVGILQTDNFVMAPSTSVPTPPVPPFTPPAPGTNMIPNSSVETVDPANSKLPQGWRHGSWGTNTASFTYLKTGHTGNKSLKAQISNYTNGSAYWFFGDQTIIPGQMYDFSDYYKSNISSEIDAVINMSDGSIQYLYLGDASRSPNNWTKFEKQFTAPAGAVSVAMYHNINGVGQVTTDDSNLTPFNYVGFNQPIVSLTFDDGYKSTYMNGLPLLEKYNFLSTQYIISGYVDKDPDYITTAMLNDYYANGQEIASHTVSHPDLTAISAKKADTELKQSQNTLQLALNAAVKNFASPYGASNQAVVADAQQYYSTYRGVQAGYNAKNNFNAYNILVQNIVSTTTPAEVQGWVNQAIATNTWLVLVYHQVNADPAAGDYNTFPGDLDTELAAIKATGVRVDTLGQAMAELTPQL